MSADNKAVALGQPRPAAASSDDGPSSETVSSIIQHTIKQGLEAEYEAWLNNVVTVGRRFAGHRGVDFIRPPSGSTTYTTMLRFDTIEHLHAWLASDARQELLAAAEPLFAKAERLEIRSGLEFWFTPPRPDQKRPARYKQFLITLSVVFPLTIILPWALQPVFAAIPVLGRPGISQFVVAVGIVLLMTYVIMPAYTRMVAKWLYAP